MPTQSLFSIAARHPMIEAILPDSYVPNDINLGGTATTRQMILTGNNMGGKSSYSRSIALIALMAQVSSVVTLNGLPDLTKGMDRLDHSYQLRNAQRPSSMGFILEWERLMNSYGVDQPLW